MEAERARELLAAERREIEHTLRHRVHEDDGEDAGWQEPANLATSLYLDELDEALADELRQRVSHPFATVTWGVTQSSLLHIGEMLVCPFGPRQSQSHPTPIHN
jgi:hypothetical protein